MDHTPRKSPQSRGEPKPVQMPVSATDAAMQIRTSEDDEDRNALRIALGVAVVAHVILMAANFPTQTRAVTPPPEQPKPYVIQNVQLKPPPPPKKQETPPPPPKKKEPAPKKEVRKIPVPDKTPDKPEPEIQPPPPEIEPIAPQQLEPQEPALVVPDTDQVVDIPTPPPPAPEPEGPILVSGEVVPPVKVNAPQPVYPEAARRARLQGVVVLKAVIDKNGDVTDVQILRDLPMGLGEMAKQAALKWKFKPATLHGKPVDVYFNLTVNYSIH